MFNLMGRWIYISTKGQTDFKITHFGLPQTYLNIFSSENAGLKKKLNRCDICLGHLTEMASGPYMVKQIYMFK